MKYLYTFIRKNIFVCLFSVHNTISLSHHEQACKSFIFITFLWYKYTFVVQTMALPAKLPSHCVLLPYVYETFQNVKPVLQSHIAENI